MQNKLTVNLVSSSKMSKTMPLRFLQFPGTAEALLQCAVLHLGQYGCVQFEV